jgi:flavin-binding protein dodecin
MTDRKPHTAAARKALQRARQMKKGLVRVEVIVPEGYVQEIKDLATEINKDHETK